MKTTRPRARAIAALALIGVLALSACQAGPAPTPTNASEQSVATRAIQATATPRSTAAPTLQRPTVQPPAATPTSASAPAVPPARGQNTQQGRATLDRATLDRATLDRATLDRASISSEETSLVLTGDAIRASGDSVSVDGSTATITAPGVYRITGELTVGQIVVDASAKGDVNLVFDTVNIHNPTGPAIDIREADVVIITLADSTRNILADGPDYAFAEPGADEPNAAIFSKADLVIRGNGSLEVAGNYNDGIASKDGLVIESGALTVTAADDGIRGKDSLEITGGGLTVTAEGDGLKADNEEDAAKGWVAIDAGTIKITAGGDAIQAQTGVTIRGGEFNLSAGGGSGARAAEDVSTKGIKGGASVVIEGGAFAIDTADDAIHSNGAITVSSGTFDIATGDDALHADSELTVNEGAFNITRSYEGLESAIVTINGGKLDIISSDDGLNVAGGKDGSGAPQGGMGGRPGRGGPRQDAFASAGQYLHINGGRIAVNSGGDGIDINGAVEMTGGSLIIQGPTENMNGALDYDQGFKMTGGFLVAVGSAGMAEAPDQSSTQLSFLINFSGRVEGGTLLHVQSQDGKDVLTFQPAKEFQSIAFSSPDLEDGATYIVYGEGRASGTPENGLYDAAAYTPGQEVGTFTLSGVTTIIGGRSR